MLEREDPVAVIYDEEFAELACEGAASEKLRFLAWSEGSLGGRAASGAEPCLEELIARGR